METTDPTTRSERIRKLTPPKSADMSMVLNGAGNGMMLLGIPYLLSQLYAKFANKKISKQLSVASEFAVVLGAAVGAVYGMKEAKDLRNYREALRDEIADLRAQSDAQNARLESWTQKEEKKPALTTESSR